MALQKIMGQHFRVFVGGNAIPEATNCSVTVSGSMEDSTSKDTVGSYAQEQMTAKDWNVSVDNIDASLASLRALITRFNSDAKVTVGWDQTAGTQNRVAQNAPFAKSGQAILNDLSIQANNRTNIQVTCQYQGSGALA
jgi:predicted secreted protein